MESKHTKGIWKLWGTSIYADQDGTSNLDTAVFIADVPQEVDGKLRTHNAEFIVTACNNYQALKEENTLLKEVNEAQIFTIEKYQKENKSLTTQLAKANSDKERLGKILKEHLAEIESSMKLLKDYEGNEVMNSLSKLNVGYEDKANQIEQTLQDCGITL